MVTETQSKHRMDISRSPKVKSSSLAQGNLCGEGNKKVTRCTLVLQDKNPNRTAHSSIFDGWRRITEDKELPHVSTHTTFSSKVPLGSVSTQAAFPSLPLHTWKGSVSHQQLSATRYCINAQPQPLTCWMSQLPSPQLMGTIGENSGTQAAPRPVWFWRSSHNQILEQDNPGSPVLVAPQHLSHAQRFASAQNLCLCLCRLALLLCCILAA